AGSEGRLGHDLAESAGVFLIAALAVLVLARHELGQVIDGLGSAATATAETAQLSTEATAVRAAQAEAGLQRRRRGCRAGKTTSASRVRGPAGRSHRRDAVGHQQVTGIRRRD